MGNVLRIPLPEDPDHLDPRQAQDLGAHAVCKMLYDGLTRVGPEGRPVLSVAENVELSSDLKIYTFTLRESLWSDGSPVTAHDFEWSWKGVLSPDATVPYAYLMYPVKGAKAAREGSLPLNEVGIHAVDRKTLVVELEQPCPYFLDLVACPLFMPYRGEGVGNGPFVLEKFAPSDELVLRKNPSYWDLEVVSLDRVILPIVPDESTAVALFDKGELDWAGSPLGLLPAEIISKLKKNGKLKISESAATLWYKINTDDPLLGHAKVRKALAYAIDREALTNFVVPAGMTPATGVVPPGLSGREVALVLDGDQQLARQLFNEALIELNLTRETLPTIKLSVATRERSHRIAQAIQQQWRTVLDIVVEIDATEFKTLLANMRAQQYQIGGKTWIADYGDPTNFLGMYTQNKGSNETGWEDGRYAELLAAADKQSDPVERLALLREAEALLMEEMPVIPIYHNNYCYLQSDEILGIRVPAVGAPDVKWARRAPR